MVERGADPNVSAWRRNLLRGARALTTPLLPDDYIELMNPLWSTRELKGRVEQVRPETEDASTLVIRPSFPWPGHKPGQYLRIGVEIDGRRHWRAYSLTSDPAHPDGLVSITVKHVPEGRMSPYFTRRAEPESLVFLGEVEHHLYPDMPNSRYAEIAPRVRRICEKHDLPYNTGPFLKQWASVQRTILRLAFPGGKPRPKPGPHREPQPAVKAAENGHAPAADGAIPAFP